MNTNEFLAHHGIKGMHWGVRKEDPGGDSSSSKTSSPKKPMTKKRKAAIVLGSAALAAGIATGAYFVHKKLNTKIPVSQIVHDAKKTEDIAKYAEALAKEPVGIIHAARGKAVGFQFPQYGGLSNPQKEVLSAFKGDTEPRAGTFIRYGDKLEKVAGVFRDPLNRVDRAGRPIDHMVVLPKDLADGVENLDQLRDVAWPKMKDAYNSFYNLSPMQFSTGGKITENGVIPKLY